MKSGAYTVQRPLQLGAAAAGADPRRGPRRSAGYGREVGEAFALRDDLLGVWGDPELTGKPAGDDLLSGKPTVILSLAHERLQRRGPGAAGPGRHPRAQPGRRELSCRTRCRRAASWTPSSAGSSSHVHAAVAAPGAWRTSTRTGSIGLTQMANRIAWRDR